MPTAERIVCFAGDNYRFSNPHSRYHLMNALNRAGHPVLWVNSIGMNMPKVGRKGFGKRVWMKLRSWANWIYSPRPSFHVLTPVALPLFGNPVIEKLNGLWIAWQVRLACRLTGFRNPLVFASLPSFAPVIAGMPKSGLIYYYSDKYDAYRDISAKETIQAYDRDLMTTADAVFCASERVYDSLKVMRPRVHYLPHAVDAPHFTCDPDRPDNPVMQAIRRPRIGYFGSLTDSNDLEVIHHAATARPEFHFVLIGRILGDYSRLEVLPNVHLLGFVPYADLPDYARSFDVGFMSWKMTEWIRCSNPLKTKEYLCLGLPVASIRIRELERNFSQFIHFFDDGPTFVSALEKALTERGSSHREARIRAVTGDTWDDRAGEMMALFREAIGV